MKMHQVLVCLKNKNKLKLEILTGREKELIELGKSLISCDRDSIPQCVKNALNAGATDGDILKVASFVIGNDRLLMAIIELLKSLSFEADIRESCISVVDDCRED